MQIARVVGTVVASHKDENLEGLKLLLLQHSKPCGDSDKGFLVAGDTIGAGVGDLVLYASGSSARQTTQTKDRSIDATVMAIIDRVDENGCEVYSKLNDPH